MSVFKTVFSKLNSKRVFNFLPDEAFVRLQYFANTGKKLNLNPPKTFNEKLQWLKIHDHNPKYTDLVDKCESKAIVGDIIGEQHIIPMYGVWDKFEDVDFSKLPDTFVLKCTHDCGGLVICKDKSKLDMEKTRKIMTKCLKRNYYWGSREWTYKNVKPRIIAEKLMTDDNIPGEESEHADGLIDYKFYCFNGVPKFLYVAFANMKDGNKNDAMSYLYTDWTPAHFSRTDHEAFPFEIDKPERFPEMIEIAKKLSKGIPFVRVDLYYLQNEIYFSEMTFCPGSGLGVFSPPEEERKLGDWITLPPQKVIK